MNIINYIIQNNTNILFSLSLIYILIMVLLFIYYLFKKNLINNFVSEISIPLFCILIIAIMLRLFLFPINQYEIVGHGLDVDNLYQARSNNMTKDDLFLHNPFQFTFSGVLGYLFQWTGLQLSHFTWIFSLSSIYLIYLISKLMFKEKKIGLISAFLYAINPIHIFYSYDTWVTNLPLFFLLLFFYTFFLSLKKNSSNLFNISFCLFNICILLRFEYLLLCSSIGFFGILYKKKYRFLLKKFKQKIPNILALTTIIIIVFNIYLSHGNSTLYALFPILNLSFLKAIMPFNSVGLLLPLFLLIIMNFFKKNITLFFFISLSFYSFYLFYYDFGPRHLMFVTALLTILYSSFCYNLIKSKKKYRVTLGFVIIIFIIISSTINILELKDVSFVSNDKFGKKILLDHKNLKIYNDSCDLLPILNHSSAIIYRENFKLCGTSINEKYGLTNFLISKQIFNTSLDNNLYYLFGYHSYKLTTNSAYFRTKKFLDFYNNIPIGFIHEDELLLIMKLEKKKFVNYIPQFS
jgi:hypothetical protein